MNDISDWAIHERDKNDRVLARWHIDELHIQDNNTFDEMGVGFSPDNYHITFFSKDECIAFIETLLEVLKK